ncbi:hypothetical protein EVAR_60094_1 [Eumeta japonica]|uniref:Uncharacterized protein n=1 Tax=Eumeta variegata TaxID=151549 RepID=A0A4C1YHC8_EUMVA|nr:hypothetical protein EVAR_60094_1 [Eumeta japonica]
MCLEKRLEPDIEKHQKNRRVLDQQLKWKWATYNEQQRVNAGQTGAHGKVQRQQAATTKRERRGLRAPTVRTELSLRRPARALAKNSVQYSNARGREKERYTKVESRKEKESEAVDFVS